MVKKFDFLVIGSGIAGMSFALKVAHKGKVALVCKSGLEEANTYFAQGGVASVTNLLVDNFEKHIEDPSKIAFFSSVTISHHCGVSYSSVTNSASAGCSERM